MQRQVRLGTARRSSNATSTATIRMQGQEERAVTVTLTSKASSQAAASPRYTIELTKFTHQELEVMLAAGAEIAECYRVLRKAELNVVGEVLKGQGQFYEMTHYPEGDVYDGETHAQYYYHAHRSGEHGHFHTFLRQKGMPAGVKPVPEAASRDWPKGDQALSHIVAISMDRYGSPTGLFTTNRWVTGETWYAAKDVCAMLNRFAIDQAYPSWPTNRWLTAMVRLFRPQIEVLLLERDARLKEWIAEHPDVDTFEDRNLEVLSEVKIDVDEQVEAIRTAFAARA